MDGAGEKLNGAKCISQFHTMKKESLQDMKWEKTFPGFEREKLNGFVYVKNRRDSTKKSSSLLTFFFLDNNNLL